MHTEELTTKDKVWVAVVVALLLAMVAGFLIVRTSPAAEGNELGLVVEEEPAEAEPGPLPLAQDPTPDTDSSVAEPVASQPETAVNSSNTPANGGSNGGNNPGPSNPPAPQPPAPQPPAAPGNCGTPDQPGNDAPDLSGVSISFDAYANLVVTGEACDNDSDLAEATVDNGTGNASVYPIDQTGHFTSNGPGKGVVSYNEPTFFPAGSQVTVIVTAEDTDGAVGTKSQTLTVPVPNVDPVIDYFKAVRNGWIVDIQGEGYDTDGTVVKYVVDWGDGNVEEFTNIVPGQIFDVDIDGVHTYDQNQVSGPVTVTVTLVDNQGGTATSSDTVNFP